MPSSNTLATDGTPLTPYSLSETLASTEAGGGSSGVGISDLGDYYASDAVEGALQEIGETLATAVVTSLNARVGDVVLDKTDVGLLLAYPLPEGRGTQDCIQRAIKAGIPTIVFDSDDTAVLTVRT